MSGCERSWRFGLGTVVVLLAIGCGDGDTDTGRDAPLDVDGGGDGAQDESGADADGPDGDGTPDADVRDADGPEDAVSAEADEVVPEATVEDVAADGCDPEIVGWDTLVVLPPLELHDLLAVHDPILINVFDGDIPQIPGTDAHIPFTDVAGIETFLDHDLCADVVLYCRRGVRSGEVGTTLVGGGYHHVRVLEGGIEAWQAAGYSTEP